MTSTERKSKKYKKISFSVKKSLRMSCHRMMKKKTKYIKISLD